MRISALVLLAGCAPSAIQDDSGMADLVDGLALRVEAIATELQGATAASAQRDADLGARLDVTDYTVAQLTEETHTAVANLAAQADSLDGRLQTVESQLADGVATGADVQARLDALDAGLASSRESLTLLSSDDPEAPGRVTVLEGQVEALQATTGSSGSLAVDLADARARLTTLEAASGPTGPLPTAIDALAARVTDVETFTATTGPFASDLADARTRLATLEAASGPTGTLPTAIDALAARVTDVETFTATTGPFASDLADARARLTTLEGDLDTLRTDSEATSGRVTSLEGDLALTEQGLSALVSEDPTTPGRLPVLEARVRQVESSIADLGTLVDDAQAQAAVLAPLVAGAQDGAAALEAARQSAQVLSDTLLAQVDSGGTLRDDLDAANALAGTRLDAATTLSALLTAQHDTGTTLSSTLATQLTEGTDLSARLSNDNEVATTLAADLGSRIDTATGLNDTLTARIAQATEAAASLAAQIVLAADTLATLGVDAIDSRLDALEAAASPAGTLTTGLSDAIGRIEILEDVAGADGTTPTALNALTGRVSTLEGAASPTGTLTTGLSGVASRVTTVEGSVGVLTTTTNTLQGLVDDLSAAADAMTLDLDGLAADVAQLLEDVSFLDASVFTPGTGVLDLVDGLDLRVATLEDDLAALLSSSDNRLDALELGSVPVGTVIDWYRPTAGTAVPAGWKIMDGTVVNDPASPMHGLTVPDMTGKFTRGVSAGSQASIGATGGSDSHDHSVDYAHGHVGGSFSTTVSSTGSTTLSGNNSMSGSNAMSGSNSMSGSGSGTTGDAGQHNHIWSYTAGTDVVGGGEDFYSGDGTVVHNWGATGFGTGLSNTVSGGTRFYPLASVGPFLKTFRTDTATNHNHSFSVSNVSVSGTTSVSGTVSVSGDVSVSGTTTVSGTASSDSVTMPSASFSTTSGTGANVPSYVGFVKLVRIR